MTERERVPRCPACGRPVPTDGGVPRPFCSERCRLIDLGNWLGERYRVPEKTTEADDGPGQRRKGGNDAD